MNKLVKTCELYDCQVPYLKDFFNSFEYPWEMLPKIKDLIASLLESGIEGFTELRTLELHWATCIDLQPLAKCRKLERLLICANSVTSTWVLDGLSNLSDCQIL